MGYQNQAVKVGSQCKLFCHTYLHGRGIQMSHHNTKSLLVVCTRGAATHEVQSTCSITM
jgi:hypothetical protein